MKFRCPYCKKTFDGEPRSICPYCGKTMIMPGRRLPLRYSEKKRDRALRNLRAERELKAARIHGFKFGNKPSNLVLIIVIMVIIGGMLITRIRPKIQSRRDQNALVFRAENELTVLHTALDYFYKDCGRYPGTDEGLKALVINPGISNWGGNYVNLVKRDPWKHRYFYSFTNEGVVLFSFGPDGIKGTADDLTPEIQNAKD